MYGFIEQEDANGNKHKHLYMLSPVQEAVGTVESSQGTLAGFSGGRTKGFLYFLFDGPAKIGLDLN